MSEIVIRDGRMSSPRLSAVVACLLDGMDSYKAIARAIGVSTCTVRKDLSVVRKELGARNTLHAALIAKDAA